MKLRVLLPSNIEVDEQVHKVTAEGAHGSFVLLHRHADFVADLRPGLLLYETDEGEGFLAVDGGTLVKCGDEVLVSTANAAHGRDLAALRQSAVETFENLDERERQARAALQKIEADFVRRFIELQHGE